MNALEFYLVTLGVFTCINAIIALGFNLQFGHAGIVNLGYFALVAVGAYMTGIAAVGPPPPDGFTQYVGGFGWPVPLAILFGVASALAFSLLLGLVALTRLRHDYLALALVAILEGLQVLATNDLRLFNGVTGLTNIPGPWSDVLSPSDFQLVFLGIAVISVILVFLVIQRITSSPLGRALKAVREDEEVVASLGRNTWRLKMVAFLIGGMAAGFGGSLLAVYATGWSTTAWAPEESLALLAAVIVGGRGRNIGAVVGVAVVQGLIVQGSTFIPHIGSITVLPQLEAITIGVLLLAFLWFRPDGILAERKERFQRPAPLGIHNAERPTRPTIPNEPTAAGRPAG
jgi:branched-chain amino acid transport system permease protein